MPRERSGPLETADSGATLTNARVSAVLVEIADLLEIGGESSFKVGAYRRAADSVARSGTDVAQAYREGNPPRLRGIGGSIGERIEELATTGHLAYHEALRAEIPPTLLEFLAELERNNRRDWFAANKRRYEQEVVMPSLAFISAMAAAGLLVTMRRDCANLNSRRR